MPTFSGPCPECGCVITGAAGWGPCKRCGMPRIRVAEPEWQFTLREIEKHNQLVEAAKRETILRTA
jgi:hypothetical protein